MTDTAAVETLPEDGFSQNGHEVRDEPGEPGDPGPRPRKRGRPSRSPGRRVSVSLTGRACDLTRQLGTQLDMTEGEVVRKAIGLLATTVDQEQQGSTLVFRTKEGDYLQVLWNTPML